MEQMKPQIMKLIGYGIFAYLDIPVEIFNILVSFILFDTFFGVLKSLRLKKKVSFKILIWGFCLKISILLIPLVIALLAKCLQLDFLVLITVTIKILILSEFYSCIGNIYAIKNKKELNKFDVISVLLMSFRAMTKNYLQKVLIKIEKSNDCEKD